MFQIKQSEGTAARRRIPVLMVDATDGYTGETGVTSPTIYISKNGTVAVGAGTFAELNGTNMPGQYYYEFTTGEVDTLGYIQFYAIKSGTSRAYHAIVQINAYDVMDSTSLGISRIDAAISSRSTLTAANVWDAATSGLTTVNSIGKLLVDNVNATISSRSTLSASDIWNAATSGLSTVGSIGKLLVDNINATISSRSTLTAANVWDAATSGLSTVGSIGKLLVDNINATISSRSTLTAANVWDALTTGLTTATSIGKLLVDNINATISSRSTVTTAQVKTQADQALTDVGLTTTVTGRIDAAISTRLASASYTTPPTTAQITDAVWDELRSPDHTTAGTFGYYLDSRVSTAGGGGGGVIIKTGPFKVSSNELGPNAILDLVKNDNRNIQLFVADEYDEKIPLNAGYTYTIKVYDLANALVDSYAGTLDYATGGLVSFDIDTTVTANTGTYNVRLVENNGTSDTIYGGLKIEVRA